jgi:hypothetical protein
MYEQDPGQADDDYLAAIGEILRMMLARTYGYRPE